MNTVFKLFVIFMLCLSHIKVTATVNDDQICRLWIDEKGHAIILVAQKNGIINGEIVWVIEKPGESVIRDSKNPDPQKRSQPVLGMKILKNAKKIKNGKWVNGTIYDPENGSTYKCIIQMENPEILKIRGYIGTPLIGRTTVWEAVSEEVYEKLCIHKGNCLK